MARRLLATFTISMVVITAFATAPVRAANQDDIGKLLAGAITLFILGNAVSDFSVETPKATVSKPKAKPKKKIKKKVQDVTRQSEIGRSYGQRNARNRLLPAECFFRMNRGERRVGVFGARCLEHTIRHAHRLPRSCERTMNIRYGRAATVFNAACLREHGYRIDREFARTNNR